MKLFLIGVIGIGLFLSIFYFGFLATEALIVHSCNNYNSFNIGGQTYECRPVY